MNEEEINKAMFWIEGLENDKEHLVIEERQAISTILNLVKKQQKEIENIKEYINSPEFLDWNLGFKLIDELEYRKDRINELLGE